MHQLKPGPLFASPTTKKCPICGRVSYSRDGIHPQCSVLQADSTRVLRPKKKPTSNIGRFCVPKKPASPTQPRPIVAVRSQPRKSA